MLKKILPLVGGLLLWAGVCHAADAVATSTVTLTSNRLVAVFSNVSDGTGEADVLKVDISALTGTPKKVKIENVVWSCAGMAVRVEFDHSTDDLVLALSGDGNIDLRPRYGSIKDPGSAGDTGDILFTTVGHTAGDTYTILLDITW